MTTAIQEKKQYLDGTSLVLEESQQEKENYLVNILGREFIVYPNVFSPKYFYDTEFFAKEISINDGERFLEIGCGTGVISIFAALKGASEVMAIDINPSAVKNTQDNIKRHKLTHKMKVMQGNVYQPLSEDEKFDIIFSNTPFGYTVRKKLSLLERATFDTNYETHKKIIWGAKVHLNPGGKLLIGYSRTLGDLDLLKSILYDAGFAVKLLAEIESIETLPVIFDLYEAKLLM